MQHQHIDEFNATDVRHTLQEIWRILVARRWYFLFPFCIVSTIACIGSLYAPREYSASTIIKREHDPVFSSLKRKNWNQPYEQLRGRMTADLSDPAFIRNVLDRANLPVGLKRFEDGTLTPQGEASREQLVTQIAEGLTVKALESSESRDVVRITLTLRDPRRIPDILRLLRESYMEQSRQRTIAILESVHRFLKGEAAKCETEISRLQARISELESKYPGVNSHTGDPLAAERTALVIERLDLRRRLDDAQATREKIEARIAELESDADSNADERLIEEPNPRYAELLTEIKNLEEKLLINRTRKGMTEAHPEVRSARALLEERSAELAQTPRIIMSPARLITNLAEDSKSIHGLRKQLSDTDVTASALSARSEVVEKRLAEIEGQRLAAADQRPAYTELVEQLKRQEALLAEWHSDITPIANAIYLEGSNRSVHFATMKEPAAAMKPVAPDSRIVLMICFGVGVAAAVLTVLLVELCDRSFRTVKQLSSSLGVPVIESIDEIVTNAVLRRRKIRNVVVMPVMAVMLLFSVSVAGVLAYCSLEAPERFVEITQMPRKLSEHLFGRFDDQTAVSSADEAY